MTHAPTGSPLLRDLAYYLPSKLIPALLGIGLVVVLTHALGTEGFGRYATLMAIVGVSDVLITAWMRQSVLRFAPQYRLAGTVRQFNGETLSLLLVGTGVVLLGLTATMVTTGFDSAAVFVVLCAILAQVGFQYVSTLCQSAQLVRQYAGATAIQSLLQLAAVFLLVYVHPGGHVMAVAAVAIGLAGAVGFLLLISPSDRLALGPPARTVRLSLARELLKYGFPMSIWVLSFQVLYLASRLILASLRSPAEVGIYSSVYDLVNGSLSLAMTPFLLASHPIIMRLWAETGHREPVERVIAEVVRYLMLMFAPILAVSLVVNERLLFMLGRGFEVDKLLLPVLVLTTFVAGASMYAHKGLEVANRTSVMMAVAIGTVVMDLVLKVVLVGRYGYLAAAFVSLLSYATYTCVVYSFSRAFIRVPVSLPSVARVAAATVFAIGGAELTERLGQGVLLAPVLQVFATCTVLGVTYLSALLALGELARERQLVASFMSSRGWTRAH